MFSRCIILVLAMAPSVMGQFAPPEQDIDKQRDLLRRESEAPGRTYAKLFQKGRDPALLASLGEHYMKISKPVQARTHFKLALDVDPDLAAAKEGYASAESRIQYLDERLKHFQGLREKEKKAMHACSQAAILFHLGYSEDALQILQDASVEMGTDFDIRAMVATIRQGDTVEVAALEALRDSFVAAMDAKDLEGSLTVLGQMIFVSLGKIPPEPYLAALQKNFPQETFDEKVAAILRDVTK